MAWIHLDAFLYQIVIDTSGAGDWTTSAFLNGLMELDIKKISEMTSSTIDQLLMDAQRLGSLSCSYEGARGMMALSLE